MTAGEASDEPDLEQAFAVDTPDDSRDLYARWADTYESGFVEESGYVHHRHVATVHARAWTDGNPRDSSQASGAVLDVGCGTGIVGVELRRLGASVVDGIDISPEMLAEAATKHDDRGPVYRNLVEADLSANPELPDQHYAGVVSAGTFTHGHLGPESLIRLVELTDPGTRFTTGVNEAHFVERGFESHLRQLEHASGIGPIEMVRVPIYETADPAELNHSAQVVVFTVR